MRGKSQKPLRIVGAILGVAVGAAVPLLCPIDGLTFQATCGLGILLGAIIWWICKVLPEYATALLMAVLFMVVADVPTASVFSAFTTSTWWLLLAAFGLGLGMRASGLLKRMALAILKVFPHTYRAQVIGLLVAGTLIGPFVPSMSVKAVMLAPLSMSISDSLGFARKSKPAEGLFLAMFTGIRNVAPAVVSASIIGYAILGLLPADVQAQFDMVHWFLAMLPWFVVVSVLNYAAIMLLYAPRRGKGATAPADQAAAKGVIQHEDLGPMSAKEKRMAAIMVCCVVLWVTEPLHAIASHIVALAALVVTIACGIFTKDEFRSGISWDSLVFIGVVFGLSDVFAQLGIDEWIVEMCGPFIQALAGNPFLFVFGIGAITVLLRFLIVSETPFANIFMVFMVPMALGAGINPWVVGATVYAMVSPWFALYQNIIYLTAYYATEGRMVRQAQMARYCAVYLCISMAGLMASVPYWQALGLF